MMRIILNAMTRMWVLRKWIIIIGGLHALISIFFLIPYNKSFTEFFSHRLVTEALASRNLYTYYAEFYDKMHDALPGMMNWIFLGNIMHYFVLAFLTGGFLSAVMTMERLNYRKFLRGCRYYGWRMIKIALLTPGFMVCLFFAGVILGLPLTFFLPDYFVEDQYFYFFAVYGLVVAGCLLWGWFILDLVKVRTVEKNEQKLSRAFRSTIKLFIRNPLPFTGFYLLMVLLWFFVAGVYWICQEFISDRSVMGSLMELLLFQGVVLLQLGIRFARYDVLNQLLNQARFTGENMQRQSFQHI